MSTINDERRKLRRRSPFLTFVANEFSRRGTPDRVLLSSKATAHAEVAELGLRCPERLATVTDIATLEGMRLPDMFVLKLSKGWSARGVMPLERIGPGLYFDHIALRARTLAEVAEAQRAAARSFELEEPSWYVEEMVASTIHGKTIPLDYKFYCFRDRIGLIVQIDRNTSPVKLCLLREDFTPFEEGRDYVLARVDARRGEAIVPLHAPDLLRWARRLSLRTDAPFVSVDLYDSPRGPVFGEFTFSPGGTHRAMWSFSEAMIGRLDEIFTGAEGAGPASAAPAEPPDYPRMRPEIYARLAAGVANSSVRAAARLAEFYQRRENRGAEGTLSMARSWATIRGDLQARVEEGAAGAREVATGWPTGQPV